MGRATASCAQSKKLSCCNKSPLLCHFYSSLRILKLPPSLGFSRQCTISHNTLFFIDDFNKKLTNEILMLIFQIEKWSGLEMEIVKLDLTNQFGWNNDHLCSESMHVTCDTIRISDLAFGKKNFRWQKFCWNRHIEK